MADHTEPRLDHKRHLAGLQQGVVTASGRPDELQQGLQHTRTRLSQ